MDRETLFDWLAVAERHVGEGARQLLQQRELLSRFQTQGHRKSTIAGMARELLDTMERLQAHHIDHRDRLIKLLRDGHGIVPHITSPGRNL
jgi:DNA repair protein RadC